MDPTNGFDSPHTSSPYQANQTSSPNVEKTANQDPQQIVQETIHLDDNTIITREYSLGRKLGKGAFGVCHECKDLETGEIFAAKIISKDSLVKESDRIKLNSEISIHQSLNHPSIVQYKKSFEDDKNVYILLELCENQALNDLLRKRKRITEIEAKQFVVEIIQALKYLHSNNIIHRDIKLGNLFLDHQMKLKLGDFGLSTRLDHSGQKKRTICGTPNYIAPEILNSKMEGYSFEVDVWSLGVILYTLLIGRPPFETKEVKQTYNNILAGRYSFPKKVPISDAACDLITRILNKSPSERLTLDQILMHPFMSSESQFITTQCSYTTPQKVVSRHSTFYQHKMRGTAAIGPGISKYMSYMNENRPTALDLRTMTPKPATADRFFDFASLQKVKRPINYSEHTLQSPSYNYNSSINPNNQAMIASLRDLKMDSGSKTFTKDFNYITPTKTVNTIKDFKPPLEPTISASAAIPMTTMMPPPLLQTNVLRNSIFVLKSIDYSKKYGFGYLLSNGCCGVQFLDFSQIILHPQSGRFEYIEKDENNNMRVVEYTLEKYPGYLQKKVTVLQHFQGYFAKYSTSLPHELDQESRELGMVALKKWFKDKQATLIRLTNKIVQVRFEDKTEMILNCVLKIVIYKNKKGETSEYPLTPVEEESSINDADVVKRLKYAKQMLKSMLAAANPKESKKEYEPHNKHSVSNINFELNNKLEGLAEVQDLISRLDAKEVS